MNSGVLSLVAVVSCLLAGCGDHGTGSHSGHDHGPAHKHEHRAPHGGTAVVLGKEDFHLEFVRDAGSGLMTCYVLDGEMENFIRIDAASIEVEAVVAGQPRSLVFRPVANPATGEKEGDTSQFDAKAEWMGTTTNFTARLATITVRGKTFKDVPFRFPEGNE